MNLLDLIQFFYRLSPDIFRSKETEKFHSENRRSPFYNPRRIRQQKSFSKTKINFFLEIMSKKITEMIKHLFKIHKPIIILDDILLGGGF